jgi:hypothetical protein
VAVQVVKTHTKHLRAPFKLQKTCNADQRRQWQRAAEIKREEQVWIRRDVLPSLGKKFAWAAQSIFPHAFVPETVNVAPINFSNFPSI